MDWRPIGSVPINRDVVRLRELDLAKLRQILDERIARLRRDADAIGQASTFNVGSFEALRSVRVLARIDGVMIVELGLVQRGFRGKDLNELAQFVCACAKTALGHVHDTHNSILPWPEKDLDPERLLIAYPVQVSGVRWRQLFKTEHFTDADLRATTGYLPDIPMPGPARNALLCLRRAYLKVFELLLGRLEFDRREQIKWKKRFRVSFAVGALLATALLFFVLGYQNRPFDIGRLFLISLGPQAGAFFLYYLAQFWFWDRRRIRLLRASRTFFAYVNPFSRVVGGVLGPKRVSPDDFTDIQTILTSKVDGEAHRASVHQFWMSLCVGVVSVVAALLALDDAVVKVATQQQQSAERTLRAVEAGRQNTLPPVVRRAPNRAVAVASRARPGRCNREPLTGGAVIIRC